MFYKIRIYAQVGGKELSPIGWACADACWDDKRPQYARIAPSDDVAALFTSYEEASAYAQEIVQGPLAYSIETYEAWERFTPALYKADGKGGRVKAGYLFAGGDYDRNAAAVIWLADIDCPAAADFRTATRHYWKSQGIADYRGNAFAHFREYGEAVKQGLYRCKILNDEFGGNLFSFVIEGVRID